MTDETESSLLVTYTHSLGEENTTWNAGLHGVTYRRTVNNQGLWETDFFCIKRRQC